MTKIFLEVAENDPMFSVKAKRLQELRQANNLEISEMAQKLDLDDSNYRKYESGKRPLGKAVSTRIIQSFNLSRLWWETGQGEMLAAKNSELIMIDDEDYEPAILPYYPIPVLGGLGEMSDPEKNYGQADKIRVFIRRGENVEKNVVFEVDGDSMAPKYSRGTKIRCKMVHPGDWEYMSSGVYAISYGNSFVVKRIKDNDLMAKGILTLHSDNPQFGSTPVPASQITHIWKVLRIIDSPAD